MFSIKNTQVFCLIHYMAGFCIGGNCSIFYRMYTVLTDFSISIVLLGTIYQLTITPIVDNHYLPVTFVVCIAYSLALYYSIYFRIKFQNIYDLFSILQTTRNSLSDFFGEEYIGQSFHNDKKQMNIFLQLSTWTSFICAFLFSVQPLLRSYKIFGKDGKKQLQIDIWCPFNVQNGFIFEILVFTEFFTVFWVALRFFSNSLIYMFLFKTNINFFKLLAKYGHNVLNGKEEIMFQNKRLYEFKLFQPILENGINKTYLPTEIYNLHQQLRISDDTFSRQCGRKLRLFIKNHQLILRCARLTCEMYSPVLLIQLLSLMGFASMGAFGVLHTKGFQGVQSVAVSGFTIVNVLCMYFMCRLGDVLYQQSIEVTMGFLGDPWYVCSKQFQQSLRLVLQRANVPVQASIVGLSLSCTTFAWYMKNMISFYLFLVQIQTVKKQV